MLCNLSLIDLSCADVDPDNDKNDDEDGASAFITGGGGDRVAKAAWRPSRACSFRVPGLGELELGAGSLGEWKWWCRGPLARDKQNASHMSN